ncbi:MAG: hypothetical protein GEU80_14410 [Dehalococcoidia bacterium]|nr:hypothetical protein [Dehalococcoidia bacterium]
MTQSAMDRIRRERYTRRRFLRTGAVAVGGLAGAALVGCGSDEEEPEATTTTTPGGAAATPSATGTAAGGASGEIKTGGVYRSAITGDPPSIHPYVNHSFSTKGFAAHVYSRLYKIGAEPDLDPADVLPAPDLAESAESADGVEWTVKLRQGVQFHDIDPVSGRELTTEDVMYSWGLLTAPESVLAPEVEHVTDIQAVDDYTLRFTLAQPSPTFLELLADGNLLWVMPTESDGGFDPQQRPIGSGPWIMDAYEISTRFSFVKHPDYFVEGIPYLDGVEQAIIPEYANSLAQFEAGNLDVLGVNSDDVIGLRERRTDLQWLGYTPIGLYNMYFSGPDRAPDAAWRDPRFRQAVSMSIDRGGLMELGYNLAALADAGLDVTEQWNNIVPVGYGSRWWIDPRSADQGETSRLFESNPAEAAKLLQASNGTAAETKYQWAVNRYGTTFERLSEAIANMLIEAGLSLTTETQDYNSVYITQTVQGNFDGIAIGPMTPYPEVGSHLHKLLVRQPYTQGGLGDQALADMVEASLVEMDPEARSEQVKEIQRKHAEQMHYVPTSGGAGYAWTAYAPAVRGIRRTRGYGGPTEQLAHYWLDT